MQAKFFGGPKDGFEINLPDGQVECLFAQLADTGHLKKAPGELAKRPRVLTHVYQKAASTDGADFERFDYVGRR